jgi:ribosome biogenesis protein Nip4
VTETSAQLVLYGRDVMGESIVAASQELKENDLVILLNTKHEAIGIGRTRFVGQSLLQNGKVAITTLADAGYYLRDEG